MSSKEREAKPIIGSAERTIQQLFRLDLRTVVVTGGCGAVGLEAVRAILESGGDVVCLDLQPEQPDDVRKVVQDAAKRTGQMAWYFPCEVTNEQSVDAAISQAVDVSRYPVRGLVCCAGISGDGPTIEFPTEKVKQIMDVNFLGTYFCARGVALAVQKHGLPASMVLIASMSGYGANKGVDTTAYNSSKAAVHQMTRSLASEWGSRADMPLIRVNSISPGYIRTRMTAVPLADAEIGAMWPRDNMMCRVSEAHEYRGSVVYLLSDASSFMTGADVRVDGGHTAW